MLIVGVTGSIATGKSSVSKMFKKLGCYAIDADILAHKILNKACVKKKLIEYFGNEILNENSRVNRKALGNIVLNDKHKLSILETIVHPEVKLLKDRIIKDILGKDENAIIIYEVPLLFEKKLETMMDYTIVVYAEGDIQLKRLIKRNAINEVDAKKLISLQMPIKEKMKLADFVIDNSGSVDKTYEQVKNILYSIKASSKLHYP